MSEQNVWNAETLKNLRYHLGWSQADIARRLGCPLETIISWEKGETQPQSIFFRTLDQLLSFAEHYAERLKNMPVADRFMLTKSLSQVNNEDLEQGEPTEHFSIDKSIEVG